MKPGFEVAELLALPPEHGGFLQQGDLVRYVGRLIWEGNHTPANIEWLAKDANRRRTAPKVRRMKPATVAKLVARELRKHPPGRKPGASPVIPRLDADRNRAKLAALAEYAATDAKWKGRGAASERRLFLTFLRIGQSCARTTFTASNRQLRESAGIVSKDALTRAKRALMGRGLIEVVHPADPALTEPWKAPKATEYRLRLPAAVEKRLNAEDGQTRSIKALAVDLRSPDLLDRVCPPTDDDASPSAAPWRWHGFGENARLVWSALRALPQGEGATVREIHATINGPANNGPVRRTVKRALDRMAAAGLAVEDDARRWTLTGLVPSDALAAVTCAHGCTQDQPTRDCPIHDAIGRQKRQHERDREAFNEGRMRARARYLEACERRKERAANREAAEIRAKRAPALHADPYADRRALLRAQAAQLAAMQPRAPSPMLALA